MGVNVSTIGTRDAENVTGVCLVEQLLVRKTGLTYGVTLHVQADPTLTPLDAHALGGAIKAAIRARQPAAKHVHVHMEPFLPSWHVRSVHRDGNDVPERQKIAMRPNRMSPSLLLRAPRPRASLS